MTITPYHNRLLGHLHSKTWVQNPKIFSPRPSRGTTFQIQPWQNTTAFTFSHPMHGKLQTKTLSLFASLQNYILSFGVSKLHGLQWVCAGTHGIAGVAKISLCILVSKVVPKQPPNELSSVWSLLSCAFLILICVVANKFVCIYVYIRITAWQVSTGLLFLSYNLLHLDLSSAFIWAWRSQYTGTGGSIAAGRRAYSQKSFLPYKKVNEMATKELLLPKHFWALTHSNLKSHFKTTGISVHAWDKHIT